MSLPELKQALHFFQSIERLNVTFKSTKILKDINVKIESAGSLLVERPNKVVWSVKTPSPVQVDLDATQIQIQAGTGDTKTIQKLELSALKGTSAENSLAALVSWLKLDADKIYELYLPEKLSKNRYRFTTRKQEDSPIRAMEAELGEQGDMRKLKVLEKTGDEMNIRFGIPQIKRHMRQQIRRKSTP